MSAEKGWLTEWPQSGPKELWRAQVGIGFSSVAVADGRAFTLGNTNEADTVFAFDADTGAVLWKHSYPCGLDAQYYEGGPGSTPTVDEGRVFVLSKRAHLVCLEAATGKPVWEHNLLEELGIKKQRWGVAGSPLVDGPLLILNLGGAGTAVNKATGKVAWTSDKDPGGYATPVPFYAAGDRCVAIFSSKALVAVKAKNGQELWRFKWETKWDINAVDPLLIADKLFISSFDRGCALLQLGAGAPKVLWQNKNMGNHFNSCVYWRGCVYGIDGQTDAPPKELRCLEAATGRIKWQHSGLGLGSLLAADGKLLIMSDKGELMVADAIPDGLRPLAQAQVLGGKCWTVPVLAHRRIYCRNAQGTVVCLDVSGGVNKPAGPRVTAP